MGIITHEEILAKLLDQGYHIGSLEELIDSELSLTMEGCVEHAETFRSTKSDKERRYTYRHNYLYQMDPEEYTDLPGYTGPHPTEKEMQHDILFSESEERKEFVRRVQAGGSDTRTTQQWAILRTQDFEGDEGRISRMYDFFNLLLRNHVMKVYPHLKENENSGFRMAPVFTLYDEGDFSETHFDGVNPGRACVIILYLSDPSTWDETKGGELTIGHNIENLGKQINNFLPPFERCQPTFGHYAMMDFTKHNVGHEIREVQKGFSRFAIQAFAGVPPPGW